MVYKILDARNKKRFAIVAALSTVVVSASGLGAYGYMQHKTEMERIETEKKEKEAREREEKKLAELREEHGIEGIAAALAEKYSQVITAEESSLLSNYEKYMMSTHDVDDFNKYKGEMDTLVSNLDTRLLDWEAEQQRIREEEARIAKEQEEARQREYSSQAHMGNSSGGGVLTPSGGVNWFNGFQEKYYNLDMSQVVANAHAMGIQGQYWIREDGVKMLGGYVMVASSDFAKGTVIQTSLGTAIVVDAGCPSGVIDVAVSW